jgi:hypothetical protein
MEHEMDSDFNPIVFRLNSRLIVFAGQLNEQGEKATFFMDFDGKYFRPVYRIIDQGTARQQPKVEAPSGPSEARAAPVSDRTSFHDFSDRRCAANNRGDGRYAGWHGAECHHI